MGSRIQQLLWGQKRNSSFTPGPPGLKQRVQDLSLKISWGCLGECVELLRVLLSHVSGPLPHGGSVGPVFLFPHILPSQSFRLESRRVCLENCHCPSMTSVSWLLALLPSARLCLYTSAAVCMFPCLCVSDWLSPHGSLCGFLPLSAQVLASQRSLKGGMSWSLPTALLYLLASLYA